MGLFTTHDFYNTLSKKHFVFDIYEKLFLAHNNYEIYNANPTNNANALKKVYTFDLFPSYLKPIYRNPELNKLKIIPQKKIIGYAIQINENKGFSDFFKNEFSKSFRSNTRRFVNRFEACFNVSYKMFYGNIDKTEYNTLMSALHTMLTKRFNQREESNKMLENWEFYQATAFKNINSNKASLFVIYHDNIPVQISLNYHFNNILFIAIPSYNIDYAKFSLGNISIYKLLEWAVTENYDLMDLEYGYLEYKRRWSNYIYSFAHHVVYPKNDVKSNVVATISILKLKLKNFFKSIHVDELIKNLKCYFYKHKGTFKDITYTTEPIQFDNANNLESLNINSPKVVGIKKAMFDFLFINKEHVNNLKIYEIVPFKEYVFSGKSVSQKVVVL
ncbi:GNAT family N-acetyltransferase [Hwangdonia lutea]|uniref:GNAT family N-acetyltransferase n=1 Tax=Hwangdonia lutea TaxID=3075823 RepID=A0AA97HQV8_9FLAO|nr:GNAT family N-acetyltransferase [Hwangdonia sp. SCSIO 19198]WOD43380.1 GNAT family N-acetyltransferase [Hwangdonia sp. SCSIO 19198]